MNLYFTHISMPNIQKSQKRQFAPLNIFLRKISVIVAYYLNKLGITPHQVLFFRVFVFGWVSLYFFSQDEYISGLIGLFFIILCHFFDLVDGDLARNHDQKTKMGWFLDQNFDTIVLNAVILTFILRFYLLDYPPLYTIAGIVILFGTILSTKMTEVFQNHFSINCGQGSDVIEEYLKIEKLDSVSVFFYRLITPKGLPFSLLSNFRDYLFFGIILDAMPLALLGFAVAINIRWICLFIIVALYYRWTDKNTHTISLFPLLQKSEK